MALAKMSKINIVGSLKKEENIMEVVQDMGLLQVQENKEKESLRKTDIDEKLNGIEYRLAGIKFSLNFLAEYDTSRKSWSEKLGLKKIELTPKDLSKRVGSFNFKFFKKVQAIQVNMNQAKNVIDKAREEIKVLSPWRDLNFIPSSDSFPEKISFKLLSFPVALEEALRNELQKSAPQPELQIVQKGKKEYKASLIYHVGCHGPVSKVLESLNIKAEEVPSIDKTVPAYIGHLESLVKEQEKKIQQETDKAKKLSAKIEDLKIIFDYLTWEKDRLLAIQKSASSWHFFSLIAWIEEDKINSLKERLNSSTKEFFIEKIKPDKDEKPPVVFKNSWLARPFEFVTGIYGSPKNDNPDPTPFLAPFFVIFFGLCLTDAGYGIILATLAFLILKLIKPEKEARKMFLVLMYGGVVTFLAGALVGGWFGVTVNDLGEGWLKSSIMALQVIDPVENPIAMLLFSLVLGLVHIFTGIVISMWWKIKNGNIESALLDDLMWLYFLSVILAWGADSLDIISLAGSKYLVWIGVLGIIATQGRKNKNPVLKLVVGALGLYGLVGYLSDVLSYSRLLALGLATGIIAMVVNLIASLTIDVVPYLGYVLALFIIIGGHIFNIAINTLGAFIHSSRLQFVEFFPKFMESGGVNLVPVKKESKYIKIV